MIYKRDCPKCGNEIEYINPRSFRWAERDKKPCKKCYTESMRRTIFVKIQNGEKWGGVRDKNKEKTLERKWKRLCPDCKKEMLYVSKIGMKNSEKNNVVCNSCSAYKYNKTFKNVINEDHIRQMRATKAGFATFEEYETEYPKKKLYKNEVWRLTYRQPVEGLENWDRRGRCGVDGAYQLDHIQSIDWGFRNGIPAEEIARFENLRMIPWKDNLLKSSH